MTVHPISRSTSLSSAQKQRAIHLWNSAYAVQIKVKDEAEFDQYSKLLKNLEFFVLNDQNGTMQGWLSIFIYNDERFFALLIDKEHKGKGFGKALLLESMKHYDVLNSYVILPNQYLKGDSSRDKTQILFYENLGFTVKNGEELDMNEVKCSKIQWVKD